MVLSVGIDVGSNSVKTAVIEDLGCEPKLLAKARSKLRGGELADIVRATYEDALDSVGIARSAVDYIATTGEGESVTFRSGHFYSMTCHARGGLHLHPEARAAIDIGALHGKVIVMDERGRVLAHRMTSQCASGSGQFLENITRYLGITLEEIGPLSQRADRPETVSSICAVLAETDVINMVSRGISTPNILKGIHLSMAGRLLKLVRAAGASGSLIVTGGLAADTGLLAALAESAAEQELEAAFHSHPDSAWAGAIGAGIWGAYRFRRIHRARPVRA